MGTNSRTFGQHITFFASATQMTFLHVRHRRGGWVHGVDPRSSCILRRRGGWVHALWEHHNRLNRMQEWLPTAYTIRITDMRNLAFITLPRSDVREKKSSMYPIIFNCPFYLEFFALVLLQRLPCLCMMLARARKKSLFCYRPKVRLLVPKLPCFWMQVCLTPVLYPFACGRGNLAFVFTLCCFLVSQMSSNTREVLFCRLRLAGLGWG
jgi:hypothetical protein